jgi:hypothetical protein
MSQFREPSEGRPDLRNKPQRRSRWHPLSLLLLLGGVIVLGGGALLVWQLGSHQPALQKSTFQKANVTFTTQQPTPLPQPSVVTIDCAHYPSGYHDALRQELAQGLHLTVAQVTAQIRAGTSIQDVAAAQHVSPDQLSGMERFAYKVSDVQLVHGGCMSQDIAEKHLHESASNLNHDFTLLFAQH